MFRRNVRCQQRVPSMVMNVNERHTGERIDKCTLVLSRIGIDTVLLSRTDGRMDG